MDRFSMQIGNIMLENHDFSPALEIIQAPLLEFQTTGYFVLVGAKRRDPVIARKSDRYKMTEQVSHGTIFYACAGDRISMGDVIEGFRTYLCFSPEKGSPSALQASLLGRTRPPFQEITTFPDSENRIRVIEGPESNILENPSDFLDQTWQTTAEMSEMGVRLSEIRLSEIRSAGDRPRGKWKNPPAVNQENMISQPVNDGTIQLTPKCPIVLLRNRPTIGGYPRIFNVIGPDIDLLGQYGPNQVVHFKKIALEESLEIAAAQKKDLFQFKINWNLNFASNH